MSAPYTDDDLRREAARQYAEVLRGPDLLEVGDEMQPRPIASTAGANPEKATRWIELSGDDFHDARNEVQELLDDAADVSRWAIDLGANCLTRTTELTWGHPANWSLAVQVAHRRHLDDGLREALVEAVGSAVSQVLASRDIDCPRLT